MAMKKDNMFNKSRATNILSGDLYQTNMVKVPIDKIVADEQIRKKFDEKGIEELAESIKKYGLINPILVELDDKTQMFKIIAGERRYLACKKLGINKIIKKTYISTIVLNFLRENYGYFNNNGLKIESSCYRLSVNLEGGYVIKIKDNRLIPKIVFSHNVLVLWENTHSGNIRYFNGFNSIDKHKELILIDISYMYPISTKLLVMPYVNLLLYDFSNTYKKIMFYQNYYSAYFNMGIMIGF
jgi:hypothetical protein